MRLEEEAQAAAEKQTCKKIENVVAKKLKEAAKVVVDNRPVMSQIINEVFVSLSHCHLLSCSAGIDSETEEQQCACV